mmetsp:Transcript_7630/g.11607  ORF Transcript_7630/g.11607 Transcript_7630/m.11607 type:complete len:228 (-) Transcript_7630:389-1072(-)
MVDSSGGRRHQGPGPLQGQVHVAEQAAGGGVLEQEDGFHLDGKPQHRDVPVPLVRGRQRRPDRAAPLAQGDGQGAVDLDLDQGGPLQGLVKGDIVARLDAVEVLLGGLGREDVHPLQLAPVPPDGVEVVHAGEGDLAEGAVLPLVQEAVPGGGVRHQHQVRPQVGREDEGGHVGQVLVHGAASHLVGSHNRSGSLGSKEAGVHETSLHAAVFHLGRGAFVTQTFWSL